MLTMLTLTYVIPSLFIGQFCNLLTAVLYTLVTIVQFCNLLTAVLYTLETIVQSFHSTFI